MSRVIFMCGPAGSGKTTYARRLEADGFVRLSMDAELWRHGVSAAGQAPDDLVAQIERDLQERLLALVAQDVDVVLDLSFWSQEMRDRYRLLLRRAGAVPATVYLATDRDTVLARVEQRRGSGPDDFVVDRDLAREYFDGFEPPTEDEGPLTVIG